MTTQKWKVEKYVFFEMWHVFYKKNGGLNGWAITGVLLKTSVTNVIKKGTTENKKKHEIIKKSSKKWHFEN